VVLVASFQAAQVRRVLEQLFRKHGPPLAMHSDNGSPFSSARARGGLTVLSASEPSPHVRPNTSRKVAC
jgi:transposase InsO family protein